MDLIHDVERRSKQDVIYVRIKQAPHRSYNIKGQHAPNSSREFRLKNTSSNISIHRTRKNNFVSFVFLKKSMDSGMNESPAGQENVYASYLEGVNFQQTRGKVR